MLAMTSAMAAETPREAAIHAVIAGQLAAINRGDGVAAFAFASPAIQSIFGDAANFMRMVEHGYPQIYRSRRHRFLQLDRSGAELIQRVLIESDRGSVVARYEMVKIEGTWRINGCTIEPPEAA